MKHQDESVRNCVSLFAAAVGQPEELLDKWLELYYRVRSACEWEAAMTQEAPGPGSTVHAGNHYGADAAAYKKATRERLLALRAGGLTMAKLLETAGKDLRERDVRNILDGLQMPIEIYRALAAALDRIENKSD